MIILHCKKIKHNGYTEGEITKLGHSPPIWSSIPKNVQYINKLGRILKASGPNQVATLLRNSRPLGIRPNVTAFSRALYTI